MGEDRVSTHCLRTRLALGFLLNGPQEKNGLKIGIRRKEGRVFPDTLRVKKPMTTICHTHDACYCLDISRDNVVAQLHGDLFGPYEPLKNEVVYRITLTQHS